MADLTREDLRLIRQGLDVLQQEYREDQKAHEARARDPAYEYRRQALDAANQCAATRNRISILMTRVWHQMQEAQPEEEEAE